MNIVIQTVEPAVVTANQAAEYLQCHQKIVREMCRNGKIHAIKVGRDWRIPIKVLEDFINGTNE